MEQLAKNNYNGALQHPIASGFTAASTADDVLKGIDLTGKVVIVTGGYAGLGLETVRAFSAAGATVVAPVRDRKKAEANLKGIKNVTIEMMDLMDPTSIDAFAKKFLSQHKALHILVNNAAVMLGPLRRDTAGNESQLSTNHLGHFLLTARLWPALKHAAGARGTQPTNHRRGIRCHQIVDSRQRTMTATRESLAVRLCLLSYYHPHAMAEQLQNQFVEIVLSCVDDKFYKDEIVLDHHSFTRVITGELKIVQADSTFVLGPGSTFLYPRNQPATIIKYPYERPTLSKRIDEAHTRTAKRLLYPQPLRHHAAAHG